MDADLMFVIGLVVGAFSIPSIIGAMADGGVPRVASIAVIVSGVLIVLAIQDTPGGYKISDIPDVFVEVIARYIR